MKKKYTIIYWVLFISVISSIILFFYILTLGKIYPLPSFEELENPKSNIATQIICSDGAILGRYFKRNRINTTFENIPKDLVNALIATEDERFYQHSGIDIKSLIRACMYLGNRGGASTITQQLAKQLFHEPTNSFFSRIKQKLMEWIIAAQLEHQYTKEEIITMYLNKFDFINNAVGIETASNVYFGKTPKELKIHQSALLVGMCKNPSLYNPIRFKERAIKRRNIVFNQMLRNNFITKIQCDSLQLLPLDINFKSSDHKDGLAPYFREILRAELKRILNKKNKIGKYEYVKSNGEKYDLYRDGLKIYVTINKKMQEYAEWAVKKHLREELQPQFNKEKNKRHNPPFSDTLSEKEIDQIVKNAMHRTSRYRVLIGHECGNCKRGRKSISKQKIDGIQYWVCSAEDCKHKEKIISKDEILDIFKKPIPMKIFSWNGIKDTILSPWDSILYYKGILQAGLLSLDPKTGKIKAWVGGINYNYFRFDHVQQGKRQVGSVFKPFVYALAIEAGYSPCYEVPNILYTFKKNKWGLEKDWIPSNSQKEDYGYDVTLKYGLANSMNTITAWIIKQFGPQAVIDFARRMGIKSKLLPVPSLALGVADLSLFEIVGANATFANKGIFQEPYFIEKITDKNNIIIKSFNTSSQESMSEENAYIMLKLMQGVVDGVLGTHDGKKRGTAMRLRYDILEREYDGIPYPIAAKTGTSQNNSDGWFIGITPDIVTGVWVGAENRSVHFSSTYIGQGANTALPIWGYYMKKLYADSTLNISTSDFTKPKQNLSIELNCKLYKNKGNKNDDNSSIWDQ